MVLDNQGELGPLFKPGGLDLNGGFASANSPLGQFGGPYKSTGPTEGYY
jgi:hypothetical protein